MKEKIRSMAKEIGADDIGFASPSNYKSPNTPPLKTIYPEVKTIIVLAFLQLDNYESENVQIASIGHKLLSNFAESSTYRMARYIKQEYNTTVIPIPTLTFVNRDPEKNIIAADFSLRHAAYAAGLGNFGKHNIILHPEMGSKVRFTAILTNLEIPPDTPIKEDICINCDICVNMCPAHALDEENKTDTLKCLSNSQPYGFLGDIQFLTELIESKPEKQREMVMSERFKKLYDALNLNSNYVCFNCIKNCPIGEK